MADSCFIEGCSRPIYAKGLCRSCYSRARYRGGELQPLLVRHSISNLDIASGFGDCAICGNGVPVRIRPGRGPECGRKPRRSGWRDKPDVGMARADFTAMRRAQGNRCAICGEQGVLHADHCHETGLVRGLLCRSCNFGLGHFRDNLDRLRAAVDYLERTSK